MPQEIDLRNFASSRATGARSTELMASGAAASKSFDDGSLSVNRIDSFTGNTTLLRVDSSTPVGDDLVGAALANTIALASPLGFAAGEPAEFVPDNNVQRTSSNAAVVHLHQRYRGIPVFQMQRSVQFTADNRLRRIDGNHATLPKVLQTVPKISPNAAVEIAAKHLAVPSEEYHDHFGGSEPPPPIDLSEFSPVVTNAFNEPSRPTVIDAAPFARPVAAHLVYFYMGDQTILGWSMSFTLPDFLAEYQVIVAADSSEEPKILYCAPLSHSVSATGNVYHESPGRAPRAMLDFPRDTAHFGSRLTSPPASFPEDWVDTDSCTGNATKATLGFGGTTYQGDNSSGSLVFNPTDDDGDDQKVLNIFYFCNYAHDFFLLLGFDEASGNFQTVNSTGAGLGNDAVDARSHSGAVTGTANMLTPEDGVPPVMNMGLVVSTNRHTAFDADVVLHEYGHGVTNRLVGGRMDRFALQHPQSRGMGEGWSDYFALTMQNIDRTDERVVSGDWVVGNPAGIRGFPYDSNFPDKFGDIGTGRYHLDSLGRPQVHAIGEIWCATLMEINRRVEQALDDKRRGYSICWQMVVDGLKLTAANPSFLDARDAVLDALDDLKSGSLISADEHTKVRRAAWETFAHFGMGTGASSDNAGFSNIVGNSDVPTDL